jgi:hypothetical protein
MKNLLFTIFILGMLLMCLSLLLTNIYLLGLAELLTIVAAIYLIKLNFKKL